MDGTMKVDRKTDALIVVDVQNDFIDFNYSPLPVPGSHEIIEGINKTMLMFDTVIATQDWHPFNHTSFKSNGMNGPWPNHCVQGTKGAKFHPMLDSDRFCAVIRKGMNPLYDSYSGFADNGDENGVRASTGLAGILIEKGISQVFVCGLALDYCVLWTAYDALNADFNTILLTDLTRAVVPENAAKSVESFLEAAHKVGFFSSVAIESKHLVQEQW
jgi:nicotinamidase/pyrazinamidase